MRKLKQGDQVVVIAGRDKGTKGKIQKVIKADRKDDKFIVTGVNMVKKHQKPNPMTNQPGGIVEKEAPISASNVAIYNPETEKGDRVGFRVEDGKKVRFFKSNGKTIS
ncbi:50S ribosomal protein L24 [Gynuella sp.]|uniref:50S ribosomal protein L24 n=1 Tax=Gynuella sp. TaxID=2969146 RepID=UPI003D0B524D